MADAVKHASGPLLVEIEKSPGAHLGISLAASLAGAETSIIIESIKQASIAERFVMSTLFASFHARCTLSCLFCKCRSGALHVGDQILAVDGTRTDHMTPAEVTQLLKLCVADTIMLEILPISQMALQRVPDTTIRKG